MKVFDSVLRIRFTVKSLEYVKSPKAHPLEIPRKFKEPNPAH